MWTAVVPFLRTFFRAEVSYNEGWNIFNARTVAMHGMLYPAHYGWTSVNYPMLSFAIMAALGRITHEPLFTARVVSLISLIACGLLVAAIVRQLGGSARAGMLAGMYCVALFCANANGYVGMDDPQMLAQVFFLAGLLVFLWRRRSLAAIAAAALLFVVGGCVKHTPIDFPLAVLVELLLVSMPLALWFSLCGICFAAIAFALNVHFGGPGFFAELVAPRSYVWTFIPDQVLVVFGPLLLPFCAAVYAAFTMRKDETKRIAAILLAIALVVGSYFAGGTGVTINCLFSAVLAVAILAGLLLDDIQQQRWRWRRRSWAAYAPVVLFAWLGIPMIMWGNWNPVARLREIRAAEIRFDDEVAFLRSQPGPVLCESLLRCYAAGKPYEYDPFNATRLIHFGKLDEGPMLEAVRRRSYGAVEFEGPVDDVFRTERFNSTLLTVIQENYVPVMQNADGAIYIPRPR